MGAQERLVSRRPDGRELVDLVLDERSFRSWDEPPAEPPMTEGYAAEVAAARHRSGRGRDDR